jgi:hypothetical protein
MFNKIAIAALFVLIAAVPAAAAPNSADACSLLTQAQVSAALGAQVGAGVWVSPSLKGTCTWNAPGVIVTLMTEGTDVFQSGKKPPSTMMQIVPATGIGDDAYYVVINTSVTLLTRKRAVAFKTTIYNSQLTNIAKEDMEKILALRVASEL